MHHHILYKSAVQLLGAPAGSKLSASGVQAPNLCSQHPPFPDAWVHLTHCLVAFTPRQKPLRQVELRITLPAS